MCQSVDKERPDEPVLHYIKSEVYIMELMSYEDVMKFFDFKTRHTIDNWLFTGVLPRTLTVKIGRRIYFLKDKLEEFIKQQAEIQSKLNMKSEKVVKFQAKTAKA